MVRVAGTADADWFLRSGRAAYDAIAANVPLEEVEHGARLWLRLRTRAAVLERPPGTAPEATATPARWTGAAATSPSRAWTGTARAPARVHGRQLRPRLCALRLHAPHGRAPDGVARRAAPRAASRRAAAPHDARPVVPCHGWKARSANGSSAASSSSAGASSPGSNLCSAYHPERISARRSRTASTRRDRAGRSTRQPDAGPDRPASPAQRVSVTLRSPAGLSTSRPRSRARRIAVT